MLIIFVSRQVACLLETTSPTSEPATFTKTRLDHDESSPMHLSGHSGVNGCRGKKRPGSSFEEPGHKPGNDLLSRDLTSYYHWLLGA